MGGKEDRREPRYKIHAPAEVKYQGITVNAQAVEISKHGCRFVCPKPIQPGTKIEAVIFLKDPERLSGEVKWVIAEPIPSQGTMSYKVGVACDEALLIPEEVMT